MGSAYAFDTELTAREDGEIIEAAWIRMPAVLDLAGPSDGINVSPFAKYSTFEERYKPAKPTTFGALAVHHILPSELENCPPSSAFQLPDDVEYLVGHTIDFDWQAAGSPAQVKRICTHALAQHLFTDCDSMSLVALLYYTHGATDYVRTLTKQAHGAMADCWNVMHLLRKVLEKKPEVDTWAQLWAYSEECRIPLVMPLGKNRGALLTELESGEIHWYLERDFIDPYLRKGFDRVLASRRKPRQASLIENPGDFEDGDDPLLETPHFAATAGEDNPEVPF